MCSPVKRLESIDVLRAGAILLMVQVHFTQNLARDSLAGGSLLYLGSLTLGSFPAPLFTFLAGMSLRLSLLRRQGGADDGGRFALRHIRRGILLFFFGLVFATFVRMPDQVFGWDILPFIGTSLLLLYALRHFSSRSLALTAFLVLVASPPLRAVSNYGAHWLTGHKYLYAFTLRDVAWGFVANGYFPLFPWLAFPLAGFLVGLVFLPDHPGSRSLRRSLPAAGLVFIALSIAGTWASQGATDPWSGYASPSQFYPATTTFVLKALGAILLAFWALHCLLDRRSDIRLPLLPFLRRYSRFSLTTYIVHHAVHIWPLLLAAAVQGQSDPWRYYADAMPTWAALALAGLFILLFYPVLAAWDRRGGRYSFEWLLKELAG